MLIAYPQPGKQKSLDICAAFCMGSGGQVTVDYRLHDADAAFYGVQHIEHLLVEARSRKDRNWYYIDNAYFDSLRGRFFRIGKNALQSVCARADHGRMEALGVELEPWRTAGKRVLVVEQSAYHMHAVCGVEGGVRGWRERVLRMLRARTDRLIVVREWHRDKGQQAREFARELDSAWMVVTHNSAAACEAVRRGVPVLVTDSDCAAAPMSGDLSLLSCVEHPRRPERRDWAARLCGSQWTLDQMRDGTAWRELNAG